MIVNARIYRRLRSAPPRQKQMKNTKKMYYWIFSIHTYQNRLTS